LVLISVRLEADWSSDHCHVGRQRSDDWTL